MPAEIGGGRPGARADSGVRKQLDLLTWPLPRLAFLIGIGAIDRNTYLSEHSIVRVDPTAVSVIGP
ncbi:hypothetical protein GCM10011499_36330 [Pelagibacterium lentulum]|uniref:Uncharacterized protein n=1 Tax=Pelagibacterium lentulum TaxID=2029865 RepID=A0A916RN60_9HYPH|nr:hypothetical protein GCM10011499_36330 [Pelagibacterium lentulum]